MKSPTLSRLIDFLQTDLGLPHADLALALKHPESEAHLPTILWQYGSITTHQLDRIFAWLESAMPFEAS